MKRKVIQIADSTQLVSLPRKWCLANNIKKGDELDVDPTGSKLMVSCDSKPQIERAEVDLKEYGILASRQIHALYKRGIDEIKVNYSPEDIGTIQKILSNETVGFEIIEQGKNYCIIKNVSGHLEGFDSVLRRAFLLLMNMGDDCVKALEQKSHDMFRNLILLEQSNNRFTTICRRYLNKHGHDAYDKVGPIYYIIEDIENVADEYKYLFQLLGKIKPENLKIDKAYVQIYQDVATMLRLFQEAFYKSDNSKLIRIAEMRKVVVDQCHIRLEKAKSPTEFALIHHALVILQKIFNLIGPYFIIAQGRLSHEAHQ